MNAKIRRKKKSFFFSFLKIFFFSELYRVLLELDVCQSGDLKSAFEKHVATYGGLDICINSAGIGNYVPFHIDQTDGTSTWRHALNVNLVAVVDCTHIAVCFGICFWFVGIFCGDRVSVIDRPAKRILVQIVEKEC